MPFFVYILYSEAFNKYYIGQTQNFTNRLARHNSGTELATAPYLPWSLAWSTQKKTRSEAMLLERKLKNLSKERIQRFIKKYNAGPDVTSGKSGC